MVFCANAEIEWGSDLGNQQIHHGLAAIGPKFVWLVLLLSTVGCSQSRYIYDDGLTDRILPPTNSETRDATPSSPKNVRYHKG